MTNSNYAITTSAGITMPAAGHGDRPSRARLPVAAMLAASASLLLIGSPPAQAGGLITAVRGAVAKRVAGAGAAAIAGKPRDVIIRRSAYPEAAEHIARAQRQGQPTVLHIDRAGAAKRRAEAIGTVDRTRKPAPQMDRDEYPPALTREGGSGASVFWIGRSSNRGAGASIAHQTRDLPDGSKIRVIVAD